jgi:ribosomal protein S18 acetylase RimI-like enzyme
MNDFLVREYEPKDYEAICSLMTQLQSHFAAVDKMGESRAFTSTGEAEQYIDQGLQDIRDMNGACFVAEYNQSIVGFVQGIVDTHEKQVMHNLGHHEGIDGWIGLLIVDTNYRKLGIGKRLIVTMKKYFVEKNCKTMRLKVMSDNTEAVRVYEKLGFEPKDIEMVLELHQHNNQE